jgi:hypothetical protein
MTDSYRLGFFIVGLAALVAVPTVLMVGKPSGEVAEVSGV